ncbi:sigma 54 modulation/S30EA ribosomal C-terminal domain-containing protein, partial [Streptomyces sp. NPDC059597]|uniref:sigma 54 modulation/S30EA ribosomal C-terminal domain-containing protein n=1 Tax=Streptomyces sp. NPDC059597 TaxID=3346879 RepID=UPI003697E623
RPAPAPPPRAAPAPCAALGRARGGPRPPHRGGGRGGPPRIPAAEVPDVVPGVATLYPDGVPVPPAESDGGVPTRKIGSLEVTGEGPLVVREKTHVASPMTLDQALYEMELVGHDFYLFVDSETKEPSVVYRRHAYDYGVIHLSTDPMVAEVQPPAAGGTLGG